MLKDILKLFSGVSFSKLLQFVYFFTAAGFCSKEEFGNYVFLLTLNLICVYPVLEWGSELLISKYTAEKEFTFFSNALWWKILVFPLLYLAIISYSSLQWDFPYLLSTYACLLILIRSLEQSSYAFFRGSGKVEYEALHLTVSRSLSLVLLLAALSFSAINAYSIFLFQIIGSSCSLAWVHLRFGSRSSLRALDVSGIRKLIREGFPLALTALSWLVYFKIDILMIGNLLGRAMSGYYEVAYKILELTFLVPGVIMSVYFRELVLKQGSAEAARSFWKGALFLLAPSLFVLVLTQFAVPYLVPMFLRPDQQVVLPVYAVLSWSIPLVYLGHLTTQTLVILGKQKTYLFIMMLGAFFNVLLNAYLIPEWSLKGAALATVATEVFILLATGAFCVRHLHRSSTVR